MNYLFFLTSLLFLQGQSMNSLYKEITTNGMTVQWRFDKNFIEFVLKSPQDGWLALGFNKEDHIVHTNLIMASRVHNKIKIEDHFVIGFGQHKKVEDLGGRSRIIKAKSYKLKHGTKILFRLKLAKADRHHYELKKGLQLYFILAYSMEDDFEHHSIMRKHLRVTL